MTKAIQKNEWLLLYSSGEIVREGDKVTSFRGEPYIINGGSPPHKEGSTGRVYVTSATDQWQTAEYYPSVFDLKWTPY